jgi:hypothetical protein
MAGRLCPDVFTVTRRCVVARQAAAHRRLVARGGRSANGTSLTEVTVRLTGGAKGYRCLEAAHEKTHKDTDNFLSR